MNPYAELVVLVMLIALGIGLWCLQQLLDEVSEREEDGEEDRPGPLGP